MKHRIQQAAVLTLTLGLCAAGMTLPASAQTEKQTEMVYFCDEGDWLVSSEYNSALELLEDTAAETGMHIGVWLGSSPMNEWETETFCDDTYDEMFGIETDGVFLYLDLSGESDLYDYISTSGMGQFYYTNSSEYNRIDEILDDTGSYLPRGSEDVPAAIRIFCSDLTYYAEKGVPSETYSIYQSDSNTYLILQNGKIQEVYDLPSDYTAIVSWGQLGLIGAVLGILVFLCSLLIIRGRYRFKTAGSMDSYLEQGNVQFTSRSDCFLRQYRTRARITSSSSGGGGHSSGHSHHSSGGGSHGGGGHHR